MDAEAADLTRMRGMEGTPPTAETTRRGSAEGGCALGVDDEGCFGREARFSLRTTILSPQAKHKSPAKVWPEELM